MCGIAGFVGKGDESALLRMGEAVKHRGPDDFGSLLKEGVGFAHARLSIIDLSLGGHQPMLSSDGNLALVFNGEIYNYRALREELTKGGAHFRSESDTEVILELFARDGAGAFSKLDGMFALALYDFRTRELFLARDPLGKKPLYLGHVKDAVLFASELGALRTHPSFVPEIDKSALQKYLSFEYIPTPHTIYRGVEKVRPGTYVRLWNGKREDIVFWHPKLQEKKWNEREALQKLDTLLSQSVKKRLVSDVPLGVFLSGGLDSAAVAYFAKQSLPELNTFSIGFEDKSYDESIFAAKVADALGTRHHVKIFSEKEALEVVPKALASLEEPLADDSVVPTYLLSQFTRGQVTVALSGDGGDELFLGYPTFQAARFAAVIHAIPGASALLKWFVRILPESDSYMSVKFRLQKFSEGLEGSKEHLHARWLESFNAKERTRLLMPHLQEGGNTYEDVDVYLKDASKLPPHTAAAYAYLRTYLMDGVLVKADRMSMRHALELRSPLLDPKLVEFAFSLPDSLKLKGFTTKYLLKRLMEKKLPTGVVHRRKQGFALPTASWLRGELREYCDSTLSKEKIEKSRLFNAEYVEELKREHFSGAKNHRQKLWTLLSFQIWYDTHFRA